MSLQKTHKSAQQKKGAAKAAPGDEGVVKGVIPIYRQLYICRAEYRRTSQLKPFGGGTKGSLPLFQR